MLSMSGYGVSKGCRRCISREAVHVKIHEGDAQSVDACIL